MWPFSSKRRREQKAREAAATAHICENPSQAHSVREEYLHIATRLCKCGGRIEGYEHTLRYFKGQPRDVLQVRCTRCGAFSCFVYDIAFFFGRSLDAINKEQPSEMVDIMDWAHHGYTCLHQSLEATSDRQDQLLEDSIWAFEEMLKFYPSNGNYPFPTAFFTHRATSAEQLRLRYPRHLALDALHEARARLKVDGE